MESSNEYVNNYRILYKVINLVSERLQLQLVTCELYEGIELSNLEAIEKSLKNSYPSMKELFKKLPLRCLHFINPRSNATMKSLTKHLEEQSLSLVLHDDVWSINSRSTNEAMTASTMKIMVVFQKFIESAKSQLLMNSVHEKLRQQINLNKEVGDRISKLSKQMTKIGQSSRTPSEKIDKVLDTLNAVEDKKELIEVVLQLISEWIPDTPKTHTELCTQVEEMSKALKGLTEGLKLVRLVPFNSRDQQTELKLVSKTLETLSSFLDNKLVIPAGLDVKICELVHTLTLGVDSEMKTRCKQALPNIKQLIVELKQCYTIDLSREFTVSKIQGKELSNSKLSELIDRVAISRENVSIEYLLSLLGEVPEMRKALYKNLERHNIAWSDSYFKGLYQDFISICESIK